MYANIAEESRNLTSSLVLCYVFYMENSTYLREVVEALAGKIGSRSYQDIERMEAAEEYISSQFSSFGYRVTRQPVYFMGNVYHNIMVELPGSVSPERILVMGAHYDTVKSTPGADDNASGVAGVLALSRMLAGSRVPRTIKFVAFALEEPPTHRTESMGSYRYAQGLALRKERIEGMICLEMIGYFCDEQNSQHYPLPFFSHKFPTEGNYIAMVGNLASKRFTEKTAAAFRNAVGLPVVTLNAPAFVFGIDFSDHWAFNKLGYKACMVTDTAFYRNPHYHAASDLPETLDYERMAAVVKGLAAVMSAEA